MSAKTIPIILPNDLPECWGCHQPACGPDWCPTCRSELVPVIITASVLIEPGELRDERPTV